MSREFEVTEGMQKAVARICYPEDAEEIFMALTAHPDFQRQLRAYVAEQMRGLVAGYVRPDYASPSSPLYEEGHEDGFGDCRDETLANIERWEKANENE